LANSSESPSSSQTSYCSGNYTIHTQGALVSVVLTAAAHHLCSSIKNPVRW
jgi:hypothetical protein